MITKDGFIECVKEFLQLFSGKKVKIGTGFSKLLLKKFSIWKLNTLVLGTMFEIFNGS